MSKVPSEETASSLVTAGAMATALEMDDGALLVSPMCVAVSVEMPTIEIVTGIDTPPGANAWAAGTVVTVDAGPLPAVVHLNQHHGVSDPGRREPGCSRDIAVVLLLW